MQQPIQFNDSSTYFLRKVTLVKNIDKEILPNVYRQIYIFDYENCTAKTINTVFFGTKKVHYLNSTN